jgi:hypothetical protein
LRLRPCLLCLSLIAPSFAHAAEDDPIPYSDDAAEEEDDLRPRRQYDAPSRRRPYRSAEETPEVEERISSRASFDDPNVGVGAELVAGVLLLDSSRGALVEPLFSKGARFTWELGRMFSDEKVREAIFVDFGYAHAGVRDGTDEMFVDADYHYFTAAPAFNLPLGESPMSFYLQAGGGMAYQHSVMHYLSSETRVTGGKLLIQYGVGFRLRAAVSPDASARVTSRIELTRFRRGYMDDTLFAWSLGVVF